MKWLRPVVTHGCIALVAVAATSVAHRWLAEEPVTTGHKFQTVLPVDTINPLPDDVERVSTSTTTPLKPGQQIDLPEYTLGEVIVQRVTERSYWILNNMHTMSMFVGDNAVLLVDAPDSLFAERVVDAIAEITPHPVTHLVYSHAHLDHVGGMGRLDAELKKRGQAPVIVGGEYTRRELVKYRSPAPLPTEVIPAPVGYLDFDGHKIKIAQPVDVAHSGGDAYILFPDKFITFVDFIHASRLPIHDTSGAQSMYGYVYFLRHVLGEDWDFANTGHLNVAGRPDAQRALDYTKDLYDIWFEVAAAEWGMPEYIRGKVKGDSIAVWLRNFFDRVAKKVATRMEAKWDKHRHFELAFDHAMNVHWDAFLNYDFMNNPDIRPEFGPIKPNE